jgi:nucleotidyltransferase substrate binding protein (TIGR01987 family)
MKLSTTSLEKALGQLETSFSYLNSELAREDSRLRVQFRAATIKAFEYTYELAVKMIRRQLTQISANPSELSEMTFMDLIRTAANAGLVGDVPAFRIYRDKRNITSHVYNADKAEEVVSVISRFITDVRFLLDQLKERNHEETN